MGLDVQLKLVLLHAFYFVTVLYFELWVKSKTTVGFFTQGFFLLGVK